MEEFEELEEEMKKYPGYNNTKNINKSDKFKTGIQNRNCCFTLTNYLDQFI